MIATKVTIPIYANSEDEAREFEQKFRAFVAAKREQGIAVTAQRMTEALDKFHNNYFLNKFLQ